MDRSKFPDIAWGLQPLVDKVVDLVRIEVRCRPVTRQTRYRRLERVPVALAVDIKIGRLIGQLSERVAKDRRRLSRLDTSQLDRMVVNATIGGLLRRGGSEVDGSR